MRRPVISVALLISVCGVAGCTAKSTPPPQPSLSASATPSPQTLPPGTMSLDCSDPIGIVSSPPTPYSSKLDVVALDTTSKLEAGSGGGTDPHRLFAKTALLVHAGRESTLTVPADWNPKVSITWGNYAPEWTDSLHIPACPQPSSGSGHWLVFPGGFSLDNPACIPLEVHAESETTIIDVSVGAHCPGRDGP